ncbi:MAG: ATP-binding protein [Desulfococcaceae bacterium]
MFLKKVIRQPTTLVFRLTFWYACIFTLSSFAAFLIFYLSADSYVQSRTDRELTEEVQELEEIYAVGGMEGLRREIIHESASEDTEKIFFRLLTADGTEIASTDMSTWNGGTDTDRTVLDSLRNMNEPVFQTRTVYGKTHDARIAWANIGPDTVLQTGVVMEDESRIMAAFEKIFGTCMILVLLFAPPGGWFMAKQAISGIEELTQTALRISGGEFGQRVPLKNRGQEIEHLAAMFNHMLDQIQKVIREMKEMTDNIAHDLKSPITRIRGTAEVTLSKTRTVREYEQMAGSTIEECDSLLEMINTMLDISETEAGIGKHDPEKIDLADMVRDICEMFEALAEKKEVMIKVEAPPVLYLNADRRKIQRLLGNLLDNAVKYTPETGQISVTLSEDEKGNCIISVSDTGFGISETDLPHIFERFYQCDRSRSRTGNGLGLSLVRAIVKSHCGDIRVRSAPGKGSTFTVILPTSPAVRMQNKNADGI